MAFIQPTTVPLSFQGGINSKTDALQLQPPALLELQNAQFSKIGQLNKRFGYDILSTQIMDGTNIGSAVAIDNFNNELNLFDNSNIYTYISSNGTWANRGAAISLINTNNNIIRMDNAQQINPDSNYCNGIEVYVWEDSRGGIRYSIIDSETDSYVVSDKILNGNGQQPKVVVFDNIFYIFYNDGIDTFWYATINPSNPEILTIPIPLVSDCMPTGFCYDACASSDGYIYVAYTQLYDTNQYVTTIRFNKTTIPQTIQCHVIYNTDIISCLSILVDSHDNCWVSFGQSFQGVWSVQSIVITNYLTPTYTIYQVDSLQTATIAMVESLNLGSIQIIYEVVGDQSYNQLTKSCTVNASGTIIPIGTLRSVGIATKPFTYNNEIFINLTYQSALQSTYFTVYLTESPFTIVGKVSAQVGGGLRTNSMLAEVASPKSGQFIWSNLVKGQFISEDNTSFSLLGINSTLTDFTNVNKFNSVTFSNNLLFVGGILQSYDGVSVVEQNFHLFPENVTATPNNNGGSGALSVGQYQYQVVYAWTDKFGQIQYSSPSVPVTATCTIVNDSVSIFIPTLRLTAKQNVIIKIYRTQVNETTFQEVTSELAPLLNDPTTDVILFEDAVADIDIAGNQTIYTTGGVLPNAAPPSCSMITLFQDRVMISGLEDPHLIWFSKNRVDNTNFSTVPCEFSAELTYAVSQKGGPITAIAVMDQNLVIFKASSIYLLSGDGPNDEGGGDTFPDPQLITTSIGCTNPNSIVFIDDGLMFQSPNKGIWLLPRSVSAPTYIGQNVDDTALSYVVSSATADVNSNQVIFTTSNGPAMVYDYFVNQWSLWTNHNSVDGIIFDGNFCFVKNNGNVYIQDRTIFYDGYIDGYQQGYDMELTTPWISYSSLMGYQAIFRAFLLGTYKSPHTLNVSLGYNFNPAFTSFATINATNTVGATMWGMDGYTWGGGSVWGEDYSPYIYQINFPIQKCTSFRIKLSDTQSVNAYMEAFAISGMLFELGQMPAGVRIPTTKKVGAQ
ncbi:MAG: hypothetical protein ABSB40_12010 [Nitrososphaeria archaeon]|jgi:hypothetical protein